MGCWLVHECNESAKPSLHPFCNYHTKPCNSRQLFLISGTQTQTRHHEARDKMAAISQMTFSIIFLYGSCQNFDSHFTEIWSQGSNWQLAWRWTYTKLSCYPMVGKMKSTAAYTVCIARSRLVMGGGVSVLDFYLVTRHILYLMNSILYSI